MGGVPSLVEIPEEAPLPPSDPVRDRRYYELFYVREATCNVLPPNQFSHCWFLLDSEWIHDWLQYVLQTDSPPPGEITNMSLIDDDGVPREGLVPIQHYRAVGIEVWNFYKRVYGGGPPIRRWEVDIYGKEAIVDYNVCYTAANVILSRARGFLARRHIASLRAGEAESKAAEAAFAFQESSAAHHLLEATTEEGREEAAAQLLQSLWRGRVARRHTAELHRQRQALEGEQHAAATRMQVIWRGRAARKAHAELVRHDRATRMQCAWRARKAREERRRRASERLARVALLLQTRWRSRLAYVAARSRWLAVPRPVQVEVLRGRGLRAADDNGASDPFVHMVVCDGDGAQQERCDFKCIKNTLDPDWNSSALLPAATGHSTLLLTVCDWDRFSSNDFLGQASLPLSSFLSKAFAAGRGQTFSQTLELPLGPLAVPPEAHAATLGDVEEEASGTITVRLSTCNGSCRGDSSALLKMSGLLLSDWAQRRVVLFDGVLLYYSDPLSAVPKDCAVLHGAKLSHLEPGYNLQKAVGAVPVGAPVFPFAVTAGHATYQFLALSAAERTRWRTKIYQAADEFAVLQPETLIRGLY